MPKEVIQSTLKEEMGVEVGWQRDGFVQLGTTNLEMRKVLDQYDSAAGWFADLGRNELNRLIRILRKARDQAYGADE